MEPDKIKDWLKEIGKDRNWLADQCGSSLPTINGWLSAGRPIPTPILKIINRLMTGGVSLNPNLSLETVLKAQQIAKRKGQTFDEWIGELIEKAVAEES